MSRKSGMRLRITKSWTANTWVKSCTAKTQTISTCGTSLVFKAYDKTLGSVHGQAMLGCSTSGNGPGDSGALGQIWHSHKCSGYDFGCWNNSDYTTQSPVTLWLR